MPPAPPSRAARWVLFACIAVGAAVRFLGLTKEGLWIDEGWQIYFADRDSLSDVMRASAGDVHPPLGYILTWAWSRLFGPSDAALRSLSALFATASIPAAWALARRLVAPRAALAAAAIVALSPLLVRYAHDARHYSLVLLLATISTERFLAFAQGSSNRPLVGWTLATILLAYTHVVGAAAVLAQDALLVVGVLRTARHGRDLWLPWLSGHALVALAVAPWAWSVLATPRDFIGFPGSQSPRSLWHAFASIAGTELGIALLVGLAAAGLVVNRRRGRAAPRGLGAALLLGTIPLAMPWIVSALTSPSFATRLVIPSVPPLAAALGAGLVRLARRPARGLAVALTIAVVGTGLAQLHPRIENAQWREAAALVASEAKPGDAVISFEIPGAILLRRYLPRGGPSVFDRSAGIPSPTPGGPRLFVVPSVHTLDWDALLAALSLRGWRKGSETPLVNVRILRFDP